MWHFKVVPFGLCNAPTTFEKLLETVLGDLFPEICMVYLDEILETGKIFEEHLINLKTVFSRLRIAGLKLRPKDCQLFQKETCHLGHVISADETKTDPDRVRAISTWSVTKDVHERRSSLGLCS